jgi:hypothetical protein
LSNHNYLVKTENMIVDIVDKYCTDDNNPIKNLRLIIVVVHFIFNTMIVISLDSRQPNNCPSITVQ